MKNIVAAIAASLCALSAHAEPDRIIYTDNVRSIRILEDRARHYLIGGYAVVVTRIAFRNPGQSESQLETTTVTGCQSQARLQRTISIQSTERNYYWTPDGGRVFDMLAEAICDLPAARLPPEPKDPAQRGERAAEGPIGAGRF
ncbi:MAG: hypothetical protein ABI574_08880 [Burkholderiales bacterium]